MPLPPGGLTLPNVYLVIGHFVAQDGVNTWRLETTIFQGSGTPAPTDAIITSIKNYYLDNLITTCKLDRLELRRRTWGNVPFSTQAAIWESTVGSFGNKVTSYGAEGSAGVGKEVVAFIRITNTGPKPGKQFIRGLLDNGDVYAEAGGQWIFLVGGGGPNVTNTKYQTILASTGMTGYFGGTADPRICVSHFSLKEYDADPTKLPFETSVNSMALVGVTTNKATRRNKK
jgi:hypothetical protein